MEIGKEYALNNGDIITVTQVYWHYETKEKFYSITTDKGTDWIVSEQELLSLIAKKRTTSEKLALYADYFAGRPDVFAQKWSNGKGYSPALKNWRIFYQLRNNKEALSKLKKQYLPYTRKVIYEQISSSDKYHRYGIYPLLKDDKTKLLVFDFDKHQSATEPYKMTKAVIRTCQKYDLNCLPEISSSGNSYHLWIFFSQPIAASTARFLGKLILVESMITSESLDLSSFDRMIPNQDRLPEKGFGNLIALPLKWSDVKEKKFIFTDNNLQPLALSQLFDQLENTKKYSEEEVKNFISRITKDLKILKGENSRLIIPFLQNFPKKVEGFIAGEIFINRQNLTRQEQLSLLNLATFSNPEYIKRQRMRMPVWDVPSILTAAKIDGKYLRLPRGVESSLKDNCHSYLKEQFTLSKALNVEFTGTLRPQQEEAVNKIDKNKLGMLCAHTGFGKTVVGCALIARRKARTLIIVSTVNIANQWRDAALRFLKIKDVPYKELTKTGRSVKKKQIEMLNEMVKFSQISLTLDKKQRNCDYKLLSNKVDFKLKEKIGNNICVFDQKICWYGDLNFGGNSYKNSSAIRLVNTELAKKITSSKYQI
ncbi:TOTE conflict system archaeo-eukaryotic primase domain-containing protein [Limosilactobacillus reuteri]|nr:DEAD/DEAH box helicase family protein [Limosilactobacillus reuteri]